MDDHFENIKKDWSRAKKKSPDIQAAEMLNIARKSHGHSKKAHLGNMIILGLTCAMISAFFYFLAPMQDTISRIGIILMVGGLLVRISIELYSHLKARRINYTLSSLKSSDQASAFYEWRKKIHGPLTITIITLYTIGFYILTPEFSRHLQLRWLILADLSYLVIAVVLFFVIRRGVRREMKHLKSLKEIQESFRPDKDTEH